VSTLFSKLDEKMGLLRKKYPMIFLIVDIEGAKTGLQARPAGAAAAPFFKLFLPMPLQKSA